MWLRTEMASRERFAQVIGCKPRRDLEAWHPVWPGLLYQETGPNRGLRGLLRGRLGIGLHSGVPALEPRPQVLVQDPRPNLQQPMSPQLGPAHLLLLDHALADHLVDGRLRE